MNRSDGPAQAPRCPPNSIAAAADGALLLFEKTGALFGRRGEIQDSRDRYAYAASAFLPQRLGKFVVLTIVTVDHRKRQDSASTRRQHYTAGFPLSGATQWDLPWKRAFPASTDRSTLDVSHLAADRD